MRSILLITAAATLVAGAALAQQGPPGGGAGPSPEMRALFQGVRDACANDMKTLCGDKQGREAFMCLRADSAKASKPCQDALSKLPPPRPQ